MILEYLGELDLDKLSVHPSCICGLGDLLKERPPIRDFRICELVAYQGRDILHVIIQGDSVRLVRMSGSDFVFVEFSEDGPARFYAHHPRLTVLQTKGA